jgi:hypothetical protein
MKPDNLKEYKLILHTLNPKALLTVEATINLITMIEKEFTQIRHKITVNEFRTSD